MVTYEQKVFKHGLLGISTISRRLKSVIAGINLLLIALSAAIVSGRYLAQDTYMNLEFGT